MECATTIAPDDSCLQRVNSKSQFNYASVLGVNILGNMVPVVHYIPTGPNRYKKGVVFFGGTRKHRCFLYEDIKYSACCRLTLKFNVDYWKKNYLQGTLGSNDRTTTPYYYSNCRQCDKPLADTFGNILSYTKRRYWRNGVLNWRACQTVQECGSCDVYSYPVEDIASTEQIVDNNNMETLKVKYVDSSTPSLTSVSSCGCGG